MSYCDLCGNLVEVNHSCNNKNWVSDRWRDKYYDKINELNEAEMKLQIAINAIKDFNQMYKEDFHRNLCEKTMGCHCHKTSLDEVLEKIE